jgi:hypothetical protein
MSTASPLQTLTAMPQPVSSAWYRRGEVRRDRQEVDGRVQSGGARRRWREEREEPARRDPGQHRIAAVTPPAKPSFDPFAPPGTLDDHANAGPRRDPRDGGLWRRMEENQKKIDEFDREHPRTNKSLSEAVIDKVMEEVMDPLIRKLPVSRT